MQIYYGRPLASEKNIVERALTISIVNPTIAN